MNPTRINTSVTPTTTTTTGSKLIKNEFRYLPLMSTTIDGVVPMSTSASDNDLSAGATATAIATSTGSLVHVIPMQLSIPVTSSGTSVNVTTLCVDSNPMASPLDILTTPPPTAGLQIHSQQGIPLDTVQFVQQPQHETVNIDATLSMPTTTHSAMSGNDIATGNDGISPISSSSSPSPNSIISQEIPKNICNVSSMAVTSSSSSSSSDAAGKQYHGWLKGHL